MLSTLESLVFLYSSERLRPTVEAVSFEVLTVIAQRSIPIVRRIREMSQSLSSNVPDNSPEQEAATGHSIPRRIDSPTSQATQLPELGLTLTPATGREHSQEMNKPSAHALRSQVPGPSRKRSRSPSSPFFPDAITYSDDTEDKELLISELQDSLAAAGKRDRNIADKGSRYREPYGIGNMNKPRRF
ncbi:hypothetical protein Tco_0890937 [Tanacetum coccineum]|uniref:Uncharacterized protein n=1 Tax=Tanacetum coccineum TaxID=301880 RepID=A0ABQ5C1G7_9ASTR